MTRRLLAVTDVTYFGGAGGALLGLLEWARDRGWDVTLAAPEGDVEARGRRKGFATVVIDELRVPAGPKVLGLMRAGVRALRVARTLKRAARDADLVLADGLFVLPSARFACFACPVVHISRSIIDRPDWAVLLRLFGSAAVVTIAPSEAAGRPYRRRGHDVRVVLHGARWPVEPARSEPDGAPIVGVAGQLTPLKGQDVLLDAVARLERDDVVVELAGGEYPKDRPYAESLREQVERLGLTDRVRFLGHVEAMLDRMRSWRILALPSVYPEVCPLAVVEAVSIGLPVIATDHGGPKEILDGAGLLVPPRDEVALAAAIQCLLDDRDLYDRCARAGRQRVADGLNVEREQRELFAIFDEVVPPPAHASGHE